MIVHEKQATVWPEEIRENPRPQCDLQYFVGFGAKQLP
jgi:hypothetical protein